MHEGKRLKALKQMKKNRRNLIILGLLSVIIATVTTGVSLAVYHNSGDIYLDRSRPGFLPDEDEIEDEEVKEPEYEMSKTGKINIGVLVEYLEKLHSEIKSIDEMDKPFSGDALSNERLGIPSE